LETEKDTLEDLELRSEAVQDILSRPPAWIIRWGNTVVLSAIALVLLMSYFIKYPEFIAAPVVITSANLPEKIIARSNTRIAAIEVADHQQVKKGQLLMVLETTGNIEDMLALRDLMRTGTDPSAFPLTKTAGFALGELQADYNAFALALQEEQLFSRLQPYAPENTAAEQGLAENRRQVAVLSQQVKLEEAKLELATADYERAASLFRQGVISKAELDNDKIALLQAQQSLRSLKMTRSQLEDTRTGLKKVKTGTGISAEKEKITYTSRTAQMYEQLRRAVRQWEQNYLVISSVDGTVSFQQLWGENQFVNAGEALLTVLPARPAGWIGRLAVAAVNSGKIAKGQKVLVKLDNFPYQEFGIVQATVTGIALTPDEEGRYYVGIALPKGLHTSYGRELSSSGELKGTAEIVTQDLRLIQRFFYQLRQLLGHQA